jgi:TM2 domain-containing membrane protein YozV
MFKIIGADGQPYGPVSTEQVRAWMAQNRVGPQTLAQPEGATDWRPLSSLPEFANTFPPAAPPDLGGGSLADKASKKIAAGICGILLGGLGVHKFILGYTGAGIIMLALTLATIPIGFITCGVGFVISPVIHIIGLVEGVIYLTKTDAEFVRTYVDNRREWF